MAAKLEVILSAEDKASGPISGVQKKLDDFGKSGSGIDSLSSKIDDLSRLGVPGLNSLSGAMDRAGAAQTSFLGAAGGLWIAGAAAVAVGIGAIGKAAVDAASESEQAEVRLTSALKATGSYSLAAVEDVGAWANALLEAKGTSDELAMSLVGQGATMGLTVEQSKRYVSAAADMESITGSVAGGFDQLARAATGDERALLSLGKQFGISKDEGLTFEQMLAKIEERTNGAAAAQVNTYAGSWKLVGDKLSNVAEIIGGALLSKLSGLAKGTSSWIDWVMGHDPAATKDMADIKKWLADTAAGATAAKPPVEALDVTLKRSLSNAKTVADSWKDSLKGLEKDFATATGNIKAAQAEFEAWIDKTAANAAARAAGGSGIAAAGQTDTERQAQAEQQAQQLMLEAVNETGAKRVELLNKAAEYFEQSKTAEVAADLAAMQQMAANDAAQYELDHTSLQAALQAKTEMYQAEHQRLAAWIAEESAAEANRQGAEVQSAVDIAAAVSEKITAVKGKIADVTAEISRMDALLKDEKTLAINAEAAKADMDILLNNVVQTDEAIKAQHDFKLETAAAEAAAKDLRTKVDALFPPEGLHRVVVIEYKTQASPIRPFTEGMEDIKKRMESLPTGSTYTARVTGLDSVGSTSQKSSTGGVTMNPVFNLTVSGSGGSASGSGSSGSAKDLDKQLADLWNSKRSQLRQAMEAA